MGVARVLLGQFESSLPSTYIEFATLDVFEIQGHRVLSRLGLVHVAHAVRSQVDLAILLVRQLVFAGDARAGVSVEPQICRPPQRSKAITHPSYNPTLSWTKRRSSSGRYDGRRAVVRSICFRNIRHSRESRPSFLRVKNEMPFYCIPTEEVVACLGVDVVLKVTGIGDCGVSQLLLVSGSMHSKNAWTHHAPFACHKGILVDGMQGAWAPSPPMCRPSQPAVSFHQLPSTAISSESSPSRPQSQTAILVL